MVEVTHSRAARDIVVCCDGTSNEVQGSLSNVLKLYRITHKSSEQRAASSWSSTTLASVP